MLMGPWGTLHASWDELMCKNISDYDEQKDSLLVVSTPLKNISQIGNLPQIGVKIKNIWNHHLDRLVVFGC